MWPEPTIPTASVDAQSITPDAGGAVKAPHNPKAMLGCPKSSPSSSCYPLSPTQPGIVAGWIPMWIEWHGSVGTTVIDRWLDLIISVVFSNLNNPMILWFPLKLVITCISEFTCMCMYQLGPLTGCWKWVSHARFTMRILRFWCEGKKVWVLL